MENPEFDVLEERKKDSWNPEDSSLDSQQVAVGNEGKEAGGAVSGEPLWTLSWFSALPQNTRRNRSSVAA